MHVKTGAVMIMGCKVYTSPKNGNTYHSVDIYDTESCAMYNCEVIPEVYNMVANLQTPATVKSAELVIGAQYKGQSRIELVNWA